MLGPLPTLHRWLVCTLALVACVGIGTWLTVALPVPLVRATGTALGAVLGAVLVALVLRDGASHASVERVRRTR